MDMVSRMTARSSRLTVIILLLTAQATSRSEVIRPLTMTATPAFSPAAGTYTTGQSVTISDSTPGATIYYTTNGTTPTTASSRYTGAIPVGGTEKLEAIAVAAGDSQSATATATYTIENLVMYSGASSPGINSTLWPYDYGDGDNYLNTSNLQSGHSYNWSISGVYGFIQSATSWLPQFQGGTNGLNLAPYTKLQLDVYPTEAESFGQGGAHFTRSTGDDIAMSVQLGYSGFQTLTGTLTVNAWNTKLVLPLYAMGMLSQYNAYKHLLQQGSSSTFLDNVEFVPGNVAWIYNGDPNKTLASGWADASSNASLNYKYAPNSINSSFYSANSPPSAATVFTGSVSGTTLTVSGLTGTIEIGEVLLWNNQSSYPTIVSGSGSSWQLSASPGTLASQQMVTGFNESSINIAKMTVTADGGTWRANYSAGYNISPYTNFTFAALPTNSGYGYEVQFYNTSGAAIGNAVTITTPQDNGVQTTYWTFYNALLSEFALGTSTIGGVSIKDLSGRSSNIIYLSAIGFWS